MRIRKILVKNFRLLECVELSFEDRSTVIVGRNNSGKTSLTELFRRLLAGPEPSFLLEDFSLGCHEQFWKAFTKWNKVHGETDTRQELPLIEAKLTISYADSVGDLGPLSEFIIDLDPNCTIASLIIRYQLKEGKIEDFFGDVISEEKPQGSSLKTEFFREMKERIPKYYAATLLAVDPNDSSNERVLPWGKVKLLVQPDFINAQRGLDDSSRRASEALSGILQGLFETAAQDSADPKDRETARALSDAVRDIQNEIDGGFKESLASLLPTFTLFGYPGLPDPRLCTETILDVDRLLSDHTRVRYTGLNGVTLPESYNGLGARNLIFILLRILEFFKEFKASVVAPGLHLIFIEEPEAHLHPQMQEVFIRQLDKIVAKFDELDGGNLPWPVQFVVTTHSSHIANAAPFDTLRYFLSRWADPKGNFCRTSVKDLRTGVLAESMEDRNFLHQYMTLTKCDLLFADKAVLIEGTSERLLLPKMIEKVDLASKSNLASQYLSIVEVDGAFAHRFLKLLEFLELHTLIITDIDAGKLNANKRVEACKVYEASQTSNACLKSWFGDSKVTPADLIKKSEADKIRKIVRIAYQIPEQNESACGRSFEGAFMLANPSLFQINGKNSNAREDQVWKETTAGIDKVEFAIRYAIEKTDWLVPRYISEGLRWLANSEKESTGDMVRPAAATSQAKGKPTQNA